MKIARILWLISLVASAITAAAGAITAMLPFRKTKSTKPLPDGRATDLAYDYLPPLIIEHPLTVATHQTDAAKGQTHEDIHPYIRNHHRVNAACQDDDGG